jgi:hypothetical protein
MVNSSPRMPGFSPRLAHVGLVVDKLALGQVFLRVLRLSSVRYHSVNARFFHGSKDPSVPGPPPFWKFTLTLRHATLGMSLLDERSARRTDLYLTTHDTHNRLSSSSGIRTRNPSKRANANPRHRPRNLWARLPIVHSHSLICHWRSPTLATDSVVNATEESWVSFRSARSKAFNT